MDPHLLRAVLLSPEDDTPRLVLSDWLEEHGQVERSEFIRVQCWLDQKEPDAIASRREWISKDKPDCSCIGCRYQRRERELLEKRYLLWGMIPGPWTPHGCKLDEAKVFLSEPDSPRAATIPSQAQIVFRRGFVASLHCSLADWLQYGPAIVACQPVERVEVIDRQPVMEGDRGHWGRADNWQEFPSFLPPTIWSHAADLAHEGVTDPKARLSAACLLWARQQAKGAAHD